MKKQKKVKELSVQMRFGEDNYRQPLKTAIEFAEELKNAFTRVRIVKTVDGMNKGDIKQLVTAYYVETFEELIRSHEIVVRSWYKGVEVARAD